MDWGPTLVKTVDLGYEQMLVLESHPRTRIKVIYGGVWLTEEGQPQDVFAASGDEVALKSRGLTVVEGLGFARVEVMEPPLGWRSVAAIFRRAGDTLASVAHRLLAPLRGSAARPHSAV
jgi:hypothetical protein